MSDAWSDYFPVNEATLAANAGSYPKPLGPILMHFPPDHPYSQAYTSLSDYLGHHLDDCPGSLDQTIFRR